jgi:Cu/Ag efflux protein CusF
MIRTLAILAALLLAITGAVLAQTPNAVRNATVKTIDLEKRSITLVFDAADHGFLFDDATRVGGADEPAVADRMAHIQKGIEVQFMAQTKGGQEVLVGIRPAAGQGGGQAPTFDASGLQALTDLGPAKYQDFEGGLYPKGANVRPEGHEKAGAELARQVKPLDAEGKPDPNGKIVLLSVGMSNTAQASQGFAPLLAKFPGKNPALVFVNGAQGSMTAKAIEDPADGKTGTTYWTKVDEALKAAGATPAQVQAVWIKQADAGPNQGFPAYAKTLQAELAKIVQILPVRFPNVKLAYLSSRTFGGYAKTGLNPEPYAFESGFSVKWLIQQQLDGDAALNCDPAKGAVKAPWLGWGPYVWTNGMAQPKSNLPSEPGDFAPTDGTHESPAGQAKVGQALLDFFSKDPTATPWFVRAGAAQPSAAGAK